MTSSSGRHPKKLYSIEQCIGPVARWRKGFLLDLVLGVLSRSRLWNKHKLLGADPFVQALLDHPHGDGRSLVGHLLLEGLKFFQIEIGKVAIELLDDHIEEGQKYVRLGLLDQKVEGRIAQILTALLSLQLHAKAMVTNDISPLVILSSAIMIHIMHPKILHIDVAFVTDGVKASDFHLGRRGDQKALDPSSFSSKGRPPSIAIVMAGMTRREKSP
jgi:hypothetical protein